MKSIRLAKTGAQLLLASFAATPSLAQAENLPGNVTVTVNNGDLIIRGDAGDNNIILVESGIAGRTGTKVNGERRIFIPDGVTGDVRIDMVGGDDFVRIELPGTNFAIPNNVVITTGLGNDHLELLQLRAPNSTRRDTGHGNEADEGGN
jgi:hypothetical protein